MSKKDFREGAGVAQRLRLKTIKLCPNSRSCKNRTTISSLKIAEPELDFRVIEFYELLGTSVLIQAKKGATQFQFLRLAETSHLRDFGDLRRIRV